MKKLLLTLAVLATSLFSLAASTQAAAKSEILTKAYQGLQWRLVGPFRAGWATTVAGSPADPDTYYFGGADGGVWKSSDDGVTWNSIFDQAGGSSIGALAVAPSNAKVIYTGTGQVATRYDIAAGNGVYKSSDAGKTWQKAGLEKTQHIGRILIDPHNAKVVLVAALGHIFGANSERGVFRSDDGGKSWHKTLFVNKHTGAVDLAFDAKNPSVIYAATWQVHMRPWMDYFESPVGSGSGIYKSTDEGRTWTHLTGNGLPHGPLGRIGLGVARNSHGRIVYAVIQSEDQPGLYRSDDAGRHWQRVNDNPALASSYFGRVEVAPNDANTVYVTGRSLRRSTDGGKHFTITKGSPGGDDDHALWINPAHPNRMIAGVDQGATLTVNGGKSWSSWYNQPTGQFYHVEADNRFPYWIYSGQQDNGTVGIKNRSDYGLITFRDWYSVGGDERDFDVPDPRDPHIVYASGLGGNLNRFDARTGQSQSISPWPVSTYGARPTDVKNRYTWFTPIAARKKPPYTLYVGAQHLFASTDQGQHWKTVSPDLTGLKKNARGCDKKHVPIPQASLCGYGVIYSIAPSAADQHEIWIGTDNGVIQLTRNGGRHWQNVTPTAIPDWSKISTVDASKRDPATAYVSVDRHRRDDFTPYIYRTHDYGKTWTKIAAGLPRDEYVNVVRADPIKQGLLYAGTNAGAYVSFDDGGHWQPLTLNLPATSVRDLTIHAGDLIAATMGRAIWVLDDLSPLRQLTGQVLQKSAHLFKPATAIRIRRDENHDTPLPPEEPAGQNPPAGAIIDYYLKSGAHGPVTLAIYDNNGKLVRRYKSNEKQPKLNANRYFPTFWVKPEPLPGTKAGQHRFVWNLRYPRPQAIRYGYSIAAVAGENTPVEPEGALALPGQYQVKLTVNGHTDTQPLTVKMDPRVDVNNGALQQQLALEQNIAGGLAKSRSAYTKIRSLQAQLDERKQKAKGNQKAMQAIAKLKDAAGKLLKNSKKQHHDLTTTDQQLASFYTKVDGADRAPTAPQHQAVKIYLGYLDQVLAQWRQIKNQQLAHLNTMLRDQNLTPITDLSVPPPDQAPAESKDIE